MQDDPNKEKEMKEIDSMSWGSNISVQITNSAFEKMMVDKEFKNKMMNIIREDAHGSNMMCGGTLINIDENGYKGYSYMQDHTKEAGRAFDAHSKDKDSFYSKKCKKDELNELWEREIKKRQYQEKADESDRAEDIQEVADEPLKPVASFLMSERIAEHDKERMLADGSRGWVSVKEKLAEMKQKISDQKMPEKPKTKSQEASL